MPPHQPTREALTLTPIGVVHSPWLDKRSAPRQPAEARDVCGRIELHAGADLQDALSDLEEWTHIWVLFWFHLNSSWRAKVQPPRSEKKRGVFSTRSPYRPNPIGMSVLRLDRVEGSVLYVRDLDIVDQTPVLDLKPYVAYTDAVSAASGGWLADPVTDTGPRYAVEFVERALLDIRSWPSRISGCVFAWLGTPSKSSISARVIARACSQIHAPSPASRLRCRFIASSWRTLVSVDQRTRVRAEAEHAYRLAFTDDIAAKPLLRHPALCCR
jgi:tRNA-Thr(GGU) m(6)t(6)A37 methyltransferase TsaA